MSTERTIFRLIGRGGGAGGDGHSSSFSLPASASWIRSDSSRWRDSLPSCYSVGTFAYMKVSGWKPRWCVCARLERRSQTDSTQRTHHEESERRGQTDRQTSPPHPHRTTGLLNYTVFIYWQPLCYCVHFFTTTTNSTLIQT